jgi:hypothetical protein
VPGGGSAPYALAFRPTAAGTYTGRLELYIPSTGERCVAERWRVKEVYHCQKAPTASGITLFCLDEATAHVIESTAAAGMMM